MGVVLPADGASAREILLPGLFAGVGGITFSPSSESESKVFDFSLGFDFATSESLLLLMVFLEVLLAGADGIALLSSSDSKVFDFFFLGFDGATSESSSLLMALLDGRGGGDGTLISEIGGSGSTIFSSSSAKLLKRLAILRLVLYVALEGLR